MITHCMQANSVTCVLIMHVCKIDDTPVVLIVLNATFNVTEPSPGDTITVTGCFAADVTVPRTFFHTFHFEMANESTASNLDISTNLGFLTIPAEATGSMYITCVDFNVVGDFITEDTEVAIYMVNPFFPRDAVVYPPGSSAIVIIIVNSKCFSAS